jgi:glycosyltransferase involved in cell wall biosynthesis
MRIIQIIDSLEAGGAERMAVNYANALANEIDFSGLITTRKEGSLLGQLDPKVPYLFLNKKRQFDFVALFRLRSFVLKNKVTHVHAHSTSFFLAFLLKLIQPSVKVIWHYHYGNSDILSKKRLIIFRLVLPFFYGVIAVNQKLKFWIVNILQSRNVIYLPNFPCEPKEGKSKTVLKGNGKRIVSLANLREDKNHFLLLSVAQKLQLSHPEWTFHLIGKDFGDAYSRQIMKQIKESGLEKNVFLYGSKQDIAAILAQSEIAILTSQSEGLPVALLEYGLNQKATVVTNVGEIPMIIKNKKNGLIVDSNNVDLFYHAIVELADNKIVRLEYGKALYTTIQTEYSAKSVLKIYLDWLKKE